MVFKYIRGPEKEYDQQKVNNKSGQKMFSVEVSTTSKWMLPSWFFRPIFRHKLAVGLACTN